MSGQAKSIVLDPGVGAASAVHFTRMLLYFTNEAINLTTNLTKIQRVARLAQAFTPATPVNKLSMLAGRGEQIMEVVSAVLGPGQHVALYGERGVGKTSLANIIAELFTANEIRELTGVKVNCNTETTYESLWRSVFRELDLPYEAAPSPEDVRYELSRLNEPAVIVIDELDRLEDDDSLSLLSDTIKSLSDHDVESSLVLVGVAGSVEGLIGEHQSVERALAQIEMPRMSLPELREIIEKGCAFAQITATQAAVDRITLLSEGLPHFTHLLALSAGRRAVQDDRLEIEVGDVSVAINEAVQTHIIRNDYLRAVRSPRTDNLYKEVLLGCALAEKDELGYFSPRAVREPLSAILGRPIDIPAFSRHLNQFIDFGRGTVLHREGVPRRYVYRFATPLMQPYAILYGLATGLITDDQLTEIQSVPASDDPSEQPPLF